MKDFAEKPANLTSDYSLFLVRNPQGLTGDVLESLHKISIKKGFIFTIESLFKGSKSALIIFAPKSVLEQYPNLELLELEDYTNKDTEQILAWEVGIKDVLGFHVSPPSIIKYLPKLEESEQFWWQLTFQASSGKLWPQLDNTNILNSLFHSLLAIIGFGGSDKSYAMSLKKMLEADPQLKAGVDLINSQKIFNTQIRAIVFSPDERRRTEIASQIENLDSGKLVRLPRAYTSEQIFAFYKQRAKMAAGFGSVTLTTGEILQLSKGE